MSVRYVSLKKKDAIWRRINMVRMVQYFDVSKTNKRTDIKTAALSPTRWFLPKQLVTQENFSVLYWFIYLLVNFCFT